MTATIIDGKAIAQAIRGELKGEVASLMASRGVQPGLATVLVGDDTASHVYVKTKRKACDEVGIAPFPYELPASASQEDLLALIEDLNKNPEVHGILVQLPLPEGLDEALVLEAVDPAKDVDGFHPTNIGHLVAGTAVLLPCTPAGIIELLDRTGIPIEGAEAVVVGRSAIVGKPLALLLLHRHATVTICHTRTRDLAATARRADILVAAAGRAGVVTAEMVKPGACVIDVGINRVEGKLVGDVDFEAARAVAGAITPVPGGVGPMTVAMLLTNTVAACRLQVAAASPP
ncbi:MAG: bifunctional methylenetetrahydrofolate dehydrogenase/methenyltetrahydrofolate cyclohydrolase FolD [bacterium]|nr:bifunctional methylenetetrahydrofolate dehydrogenase/methenyltetrahydrofolate cyclohydrolase FolD [bacterium]